jgi:hypothetical protein
VSRRAAAVTAGACALLAVAAAAYVVVGGLPGLLYAGAVVMAGLFVAVKLGVVPSPTGPRKSTVIAELRAELEASELRVTELQDRLERETEEAHVLQGTHEARIHELERARDALQARADEERARFEQFLGELTGEIGQRGDELAALEREVTALVGG